MSVFEIYFFLLQSGWKLESEKLMKGTPCILDQSQTWVHLFYVKNKFKHLHQQTIIWKHRQKTEFSKCSIPVKDTKFSSSHQREIMFSALIWNTVHGLFRQENSSVARRWQNVMNIQLTFLLKCIILYLASRIGYFYEAKAQAITVPFTEN